MNLYNDPLKENYYALLLAITYPYFLTADEALYAIQNGVNPLVITEQTVMEGFRLSARKKEPVHFKDMCGRRYEIIRLIADVICEVNCAMRSMRDYELEKYRKSIVRYMKGLRERMEKERIR